MALLSETVLDALAYFDEGVVTCHPPATEAMIAAAEERLGAQLPPSLRAFLAVYNGLKLPDDFLILGVPPVDGIARLNIVESTLLDRVYGAPASRVVLTQDGTGDSWVLLTERPDEQGEYGVAEIDHETSEIMWYGGSNFERFLWFQIERHQRLFAPDGTPKRAYYQYIAMAPDDWEEDEGPDWLEEEPELPWPYQDREWILRHDPGLARFAPPTDEGDDD